MGMYHAQYNQMTAFKTEYVFFKYNRLVLIVGCLFAKASTAIASRGGRRGVRYDDFLTWTIKMSLRSAFEEIS